MWAASAGVLVYALLMCFAEAVSNLVQDPSAATAAGLVMVPLSALFVVGMGTFLLIVPAGWGIATVWGFLQWRLLTSFEALKVIPSAICGLVPGAVVGSIPVLLMLGMRAEVLVVSIGAASGAIAGAVAGAVLVSKTLD